MGVALASASVQLRRLVDGAQHTALLAEASTTEGFRKAYSQARVCKPTGHSGPLPQERCASG